MTTNSSKKKTFDVVVRTRITMVTIDGEVGYDQLAEVAQMAFEEIIAGDYEGQYKLQQHAIGAYWKLSEYCNEDSGPILAVVDWLVSDEPTADHTVTINNGGISQS